MEHVLGLRLPEVATRGVVGDFGEERHSDDAIEVLASAHLVVEVFDEEYYAHGDEQSQHERHKQNVALDGRGGQFAAVRRCHDAGVVGGECLV